MRLLIRALPVKPWASPALPDLRTFGIRLDQVLSKKVLRV